jgi:hypothetical protein
MPSHHPARYGRGYERFDRLYGEKSFLVADRQTFLGRIRRGEKRGKSTIAGQRKRKKRLVDQKIIHQV